MSVNLKLCLFLVPPRIHHITSNGRVEVKKGSPVRLECKASGNPVPTITWSRRNNLLPSGDQTLTIPILSLDRVDRHQAGVYQCTASNGVGEDVTEQIVLHVLCKYCFLFNIVFLYVFNGEFTRRTTKFEKFPVITFKNFHCLFH